MAQFYTLLTQVGQAKLANAVALGNTIELTHLAVGDGGGSVPTPDSDRASLINEVRRAPINRVEVDADNPNWVVVEQVMPPDVGGWTIREIGVFDSAGDLIAYGNYPETYKPTLDEGSGRTQTVRMVLQVSDTAAVTLKVDPSVVLSTRKYVDDQRAAHEASRNHPSATTSAPGFVTKASTTEARTGAPDKYPDAAALMATLDFYGVSGAVQIPAESDLNGYVQPGLYIYSSGGTPANAPINGASFLRVINRKDAGLPLQFYYRVYQNRVFYRSRTGPHPSDPWNPWVELHHGGNQLALGTTALSARSAMGLGTAAQADDAKYAHRANNLADLPDKAAAFGQIKQLATETSTGVVEKATESEALAGAPNKFPDAAAMRAAIDDGMAFQHMAVFDSPGATTWPVPEELKAGRRRAYVTVIGGGGGGGNHAVTGGGGGSGGGVAHKLIDLTDVESVEIVVGSGGAGAPASASNTSGSSGGTSSFGNYCSATGGAGSQNWCPGPAGEGIGGDINTSLGPGSAAAFIRNQSNMKGSPGAGGGPGANPHGAGNDGARGFDAEHPGGGGGGGTTQGGGGNGAPGIVIVRW
jgi:hypothetical protein